MRGKPLFTTLNKLNSRITPADAGKTLLVRLTPSAFQDHPRGCGENLRHGSGLPPMGGSPPRMRGKLDRRITVGGLARITPADAGKTQVLADGGNTDEDHPRGCGENTKKIL